MRKTKIIFLTPGVQTGGAEKQLAMLAKGLQQRNFEPLIISLTQGNTPHTLPDFNGLNVVECDCKWRLGLPANIIRLREIIKDYQPHIIQGWMYGGNIVASLLTGGIDADIYHAVRASDMDQKRYGRKIWLNAKLSARAKMVVANSFSGAGFHISKGYDARRMHVISNGIDTEMFHPDSGSRQLTRTELGVRSDQPLFLYVARVDPMKAHEKIISVARLCPDIKFVFVGSGTEHLKVPENVITLGLRKDMVALYNAADWLLSLSNFGEGFPNVIGEAMACGVPVCANDVGDSWFVMGDTGHLCQGHMPEQIATEIMALAKKRVSYTERKKLACHIQTIFSIDTMINAYISLYQHGKNQDAHD